MSIKRFFPFKPELRQAIREGRKTQTRRVVPQKGPFAYFRDGVDGPECWTGFMGWQSADAFLDAPGLNTNRDIRPRHWPGDIVCMREPLMSFSPRSRPPCRAYYADTTVLGANLHMSQLDPVLVNGRQEMFWRWKTAHLSDRFMPVEAARTFMRVTDVRVQRVQDISEEDARAEGVEQLWERDAHTLDAWRDYLSEDNDDNDGGACYHTARESFRSLWDSINGKKPGCSWDDSPWVWAYTWQPLTRDEALINQPSGVCDQHGATEEDAALQDRREGRPP